MQVETKRLYIRQVTEDDFDLVSLICLKRCFALFENLADGKENQTKFLQGMWETTQDPTVLTDLIFLRYGDQFCGRVNMQKIDEAVPELGIDLPKEYQYQSYGPEAITAFANWYGESRHISEIKVPYYCCKHLQHLCISKAGGNVHTREFVLFDRRKKPGGRIAGKAGSHPAGPEHAGIPPEAAGYRRFRYRPVTLLGISVRQSCVSPVG